MSILYHINIRFSEDKILQYVSQDLLLLKASRPDPVLLKWSGSLERGTMTKRNSTYLVCQDEEDFLLVCQAAGRKCRMHNSCCSKNVRENSQHR